MLVCIVCLVCEASKQRSYCSARVSLSKLQGILITEKGLDNLYFDIAAVLFGSDVAI